MPGSPHGIPDWTPTIADLLKPQGYATGQFGKNHLGDNNKHLPTVHGFDEFFGNLYHLNAEEEPEGYYYPKDPEFKKKYGPRGVLHCTATDVDDPTVDPKWGKVGKQKIEDTGPLDQQPHAHHRPGDLRACHGFHRSLRQARQAVLRLVQRHPHARLDPPQEGVGRADRASVSTADGMVEHDDMVGELLKKIDDLKLADNTIVIYGTDNGAEVVSWPDGGTTPFHGEKGTTWEGGFRVPCLVRWPGVIKPGTIINDIMSQEDWMPTFLAAAGEPDIVEKLKQGYEANGRDLQDPRRRLQLPAVLQGRGQESRRARRSITSGRGASSTPSAGTTGRCTSPSRPATSPPASARCRAGRRSFISAPTRMSGPCLIPRCTCDGTPTRCGCSCPCSRRSRSSWRRSAVPVPGGKQLNASDINYQTLKAAAALKRLQEIESLHPPNN